MPQQLVNTQRAAYDSCVKMAKEHGWWATYHTMVEDGFSLNGDQVDWVAMLDRWEQEEKSKQV